MMVRLNIRHELPQIGIRQTLGRIDETGIIQPRSRGTNQQARSNMTVSQPSLELDSYPSRRTYGDRTMGDFTAERGQRGYSDVRQATSRHTQRGWSKIDNGAKPGNDIVQTARADMFSNYQATPVFSIEFPPDVEVEGHPSEVVGEPDLGDISVDIETAPSARIHYTPGNVETYLKNEGFIRRWTTIDKYDIYA